MSRSGSNQSAGASSTFGYAAVITPRATKQNRFHRSVFGAVVNDRLLPNKELVSSSNAKPSATKFGQRLARAEGKLSYADSRSIKGNKNVFSEVSSTFGSATSHSLTNNSIGEYVAGANISQMQLDVHYPNALSASSSYLVFKSKNEIR